jgi:transformation/transcription domain-associated protein
MLHPIARELLIKILDTFATKFTTLNLLFMDYQRHHQKKKNAEFNDDSSTEQPTDYFDFEQARPIHTASPNELQQDVINGILLYIMTFINAKIFIVISFIF